ncbi:hypothetical protein MCC01989_14550 [Bifidobacteriaceae bacterium MCC01989]|nr:hypothetical protein MCC01989_14550 [Bifidobacteriaceae bacterium MCC01989]
MVSILPSRACIRYGGWPLLFPESARFPLILEGDSNGKGIGLMADANQRETTSVTLYGLICIASNEDGDGNV